MACLLVEQVQPLLLLGAQALCVVRGRCRRFVQVHRVPADGHLLLLLLLGPPHHRPRGLLGPLHHWGPPTHQEVAFLTS